MAFLFSRLFNEMKLRISGFNSTLRAKNWCVRDRILNKEVKKQMDKNHILVILLSVLILLSWGKVYSNDEGLVGWWKFDDYQGKNAYDLIGKKHDAIKGNFKYVTGVDSSALEFDGFTTSVVRKAQYAPSIEGSFSVTAWVALGAYPWNWCPIVSQSEEAKAGYYFGIDSQGCLGLRLAIGGKWIECKSPLNTESKVGLELRNGIT